jgi:hypothetical protein
MKDEYGKRIARELGDIGCAMWVIAIALASIAVAYCQS